ILNGQTSIQTVVSNLQRMAQQVRGRGHFPLYSTLIPRIKTANKDRNNFVTFALVVAIRDLTASGSRIVAEPWEVFFWTPNRDQTIYYLGADPVGHPNAVGFQLLAEMLADKLLEIDSLGPVFSGLEKTGSSTEIKKKDRLDATLHESGAGINRKETFFTLNARQVPTDLVGTKRRVEISHTIAKKELVCVGRVGIHTEDLAEPPNVRDLFLIEYSVAGVKSPVGDVDGDCRVDGADLVIFGRGFGAIVGDERYNPILDFNGDGKIGGKDFSKLAKNFGVDKS
ncbi:MAG: dockerin type I domain-containing protein, partial [Thermoanaerobaculia bacterium]